MRYNISPFFFACLLLPRAVAFVSQPAVLSPSLTRKTTPTPLTPREIQSNEVDIAGGSAASSGSLSSNVEAKEKIDLMGKFSKDLLTLSQLRPPIAAADKSAEEDFKNAGSAHNKLWTIHTWRAHADPPHLRYFRIAKKSFQSSTARNILPTVFFSSGWALLVAYIAETLNPVKVTAYATGARAVLTFMASPLALLLTLRTNASLARLAESRQVWGSLVTRARTLSNMIKVFLYPYNPEASILAARHIAVIGWVLKAYVRGEGDASQREVLQAMLGATSKDYLWLDDQPKKTVAVTSRLRQICTIAQYESTGIKNKLASSTNLLIEEQISGLESAVGTCERLFGSPIPPTYSRHLSRVLGFWLLLLPITLLGGGLPPIAVSAAVFVATYVVVGFDEIGMEIENSFQLLPLQQLGASVQQEVRGQFLNEMPEIED